MGLGATSLLSYSHDSSSSALVARAPAVSPFSKAAIISPISGPAQWLATLTTPTAPTDSRGSVWSSVPE